MAYTFLEVTNLALREINEVPLTEQQFLNARGLQKYARESVNRAYYDISNVSNDWAWLQNQTINTANMEVRKLPEGQQWYEINDLLDTNKSTIDWDSFILTDKDLLSTDPLVIASKPNLVKGLRFITYEEWLRLYRKQDFSGVKGEPKFVIRYPSGKFGVSPIPDKDYFVEFNVHNNAVRFVNPTDIIPFPEEFMNVLVARCAYYLWKFRENADQANFARQEYKEALSSMKRKLLSNKQDRMRLI